MTPDHDKFVMLLRYGAPWTLTGRMKEIK